MTQMLSNDEKIEGAIRLKGSSLNGFSLNFQELSNLAKNFNIRQFFTQILLSTPQKLSTTPPSRVSFLKSQNYQFQNQYHKVEIEAVNV
jgi:hypothetical protein